MSREISSQGKGLRVKWVTTTTTKRKQGREKKGYLFFTLKLQVILNSATISPSLLVPTLRIVASVPFPLAAASLMAYCTRWPSSQVKLVRPVAFLEKLPSTFNTSILIGGSS